MSYNHVVAKQVQVPGGLISQSVTYTGSGLASVQDAIANATTDGLINIAFDKDDLKSLVILSDQAITLKTNSNSAPDNTWSIQANVLFEWQYGGYYTNPVNADVTKMYVTNVSGATAALNISALTDATP